MSREQTGYKPTGLPIIHPFAAGIDIGSRFHIVAVSPDFCDELSRLSKRQLRKVSHVLTLQYDKAIYLLADTPFNRALIGKYINVFDHPDGRIEIRADGTTLPYVRYDRLPQVDQGAIVDNKRLGHALQVANLVQQQRDNRRSHSVPARTNLGGPVRKPRPDPQRKTQRQLDAADVEEAIRRCWP